MVRYPTLSYFMAMKRKIFACFILICSILTPLSIRTSASSSQGRIVQTSTIVRAAESDSSNEKSEADISAFIHRVDTTWPWYLTRAAGLLSALLLVVMVLFGIGLVTGFTYRYFEPIKAWQIHRSIGIAFGISLATHILSLIVDRVVPFSITDVLVPFHSTFRSLAIGGMSFGSLFLALGILSFYFLVLILYTSLISRERNLHLWNLIHYLSYLVVPFVFFHSLYLGTDLANPTIRTFSYASLAILSLAGGIRLLRLGALKKS